MKPFAISESHLTLSEVQWENKAKEDYKPEKKVAHHWQRTDSIHITASACVRLYNISKLHAFPVLALEKKNGSVAKTNICLKYIRSVQRLLFEVDGCHLIGIRELWRVRSLRTITWSLQATIYKTQTRRRQSWKGRKFKQMCLCADFHARSRPSKNSYYSSITFKLCLRK